MIKCKYFNLHFRIEGEIGKQYSLDIENNHDSYINTNESLVLKNINLKIKRGELIGIIGEVSSGKSSLLQAILNNLIMTNNSDSSQESSISLNGNIAYVSQTPWIQNDTIRNNIVFFKDFDSNLYQKTIEICELSHDLEFLEGGDLTEIGEKGLNLSGGQKARVSIARAVYSDRDIYLFDDPISALDSHVGKKIMNNLILTHLKGKTVLLVTHAVQYLQHMTRIIYIKDGEIFWDGNYEELTNQSFFQEMTSKLKINKKQKYEEDQYQYYKIKNASIKQITQDEKSAEGSIDFSIYFIYLEYMGGVKFIVFVFFIMVIWQAIKAGSDYWLAIWSTQENQESNEKWKFFSIYALLGLGSTIFIFARVYLLTRNAVTMSVKLHYDMLSKLINAPVNIFHDTTPRAQIYNRLSKDFFSVISMNFNFGSIFNYFLTSLGSIVICAIFQPLTLLFVPLFLIFGYCLSKFYLKGSRNLSRLEGVTKSPMLNTVSEALAGTITIRAYQMEESYKEKFYRNLNESFKVEILVGGVASWYGMYIDFISVGYIAFITLIIFLYENSLSPQSVGLMLTYAFNLKNKFFELFKVSANLENAMVALERCLEYTTIGEEKEFETVKDIELKRKSWPNSGNIEFRNYSVKYRPNTEVILKNICFKISSGERIGIVGRTGSGKSTICLCLFRILEAYTGNIFIDGEDISQIGLDLLRQKITIIPQDPSLMRGTLKYNLDPFDCYSDQEILMVLDMVAFSIKNLDKEISEGGDNLSVGERQLVCIARAILRVSRI